MMNMGEKLSEEECDFLVDVSNRVEYRVPDKLNCQLEGSGHGRRWVNQL